MSDAVFLPPLGDAREFALVPSSVNRPGRGLDVAVRGGITYGSDGSEVVAPETWITLDDNAVNFLLVDQSGRAFVQSGVKARSNPLVAVITTANGAVTRVRPGTGHPYPFIFPTE